MVPPTFSFMVLFMLLLMLCASAATFAMLTRRWTNDRPRAALLDWARDRRFRVVPAEQLTVPIGLDALAGLYPVVEEMLIRGTATVVRATTSGTGTERHRWHLLLMTTSTARTPAALRPAAAAVSFVDLFMLPAFPAVLTPDRFAVHATDATAARAMTHSPARGLLPPDVGLLVHGPHVTVDFSIRPFDAVEIDRMLVIAGQILPGLPAV
jgi:hypothetical protein